jgi:hypothetical protein
MSTGKLKFSYTNRSKLRNIPALRQFEENIAAFADDGNDCFYFLYAMSKSEANMR